jgi:hypothetical protein
MSTVFGACAQLVMAKDSSIWSYNTLEATKVQVGQLPALLAAEAPTILTYPPTRTVVALNDTYVVTRDRCYLVISTYAGKALLHIRSAMHSIDLDVCATHAEAHLLPRMSVAHLHALQS